MFLTKCCISHPSNPVIRTIRASQKTEDNHNIHDDGFRYLHLTVCVDHVEEHPQSQR